MNQSEHSDAQLGKLYRQGEPVASPAELDQRILERARQHAAAPAPLRVPRWLPIASAVGVVGLTVMLILPMQQREGDSAGVGAGTDTSTDSNTRPTGKAVMTHSQDSAVASQQMPRAVLTEVETKAETQAAAGMAAPAAKSSMRAESRELENDEADNFYSRSQLSPAQESVIQARNTPPLTLPEQKIAELVEKMKTMSLEDAGKLLEQFREEFPDYTLTPRQQKLLTPLLGEEQPQSQ